MTNCTEPCESLAAQLQEALAQLQALGLKVANLEARLQARETPTVGPGPVSSGLDFLDRHRHLHLPGQAHERPTNTNGSAAERLRHAQGHPPTGDSAAASAGPQPRPSDVEVPMSATRMVMAQIVSPGDSLGLDICNVRGWHGPGPRGGPCWPGASSQSSLRITHEGVLPACQGCSVPCRGLNPTQTLPTPHHCAYNSQGGTVLSWIDICAGLAAKTYARGPCVTASVDAVHFLRPCHVRGGCALRGCCWELMAAMCTACGAVVSSCGQPAWPRGRACAPPAQPLALLRLLPSDWRLVVSHPVAALQVGSVVIIAAMVNRTFRSSMEVGGQGTGGCKGGLGWAGA